MISKVKNTVPWTYVSSDLNGKEIDRTFYEKELQKADQAEFRDEKVIKRKGDKLYVKWKDYDNFFNSWTDKLLYSKYIKMSEYFPKLYEPFGGNISVKLYLSNYATKADLKSATGVDTSKLPTKSNLTKLKA